MYRTMAVFLALAALCGNALAWNVDPNLITSSEFPATRDTFAIGGNTGTGKLVAAYWSEAGSTVSIIYAEKNPSTGAWDRENIVSLQENATTEYAQSNLSIDVTPAGVPIIAYSYIRNTLNEGNVTGSEAIFKICQKAATGIAHERTWNSYTYTSGEDPSSPGIGLCVGDASNVLVISVVGAYTTQISQRLLLELLDGPENDFARKEILLEKNAVFASWDSPGMLCGGGFTWDSLCKSRLMLAYRNSQQTEQSDVAYYGYVDHQTTITPGNIIQQLLCPPSTSTSSTFEQIGIVAAMAPGGGPFMTVASDSCLNIAYVEYGSMLVRHGYEVSPLSAAWLDSSVMAENGRPASASWDAQGCQYIPLCMSCTPAPRIIFTERNTSTHALAVRAAVKNSYWRWSSPLAINCNDWELQTSKTGDTVGFFTSTSENNIQVAHP